MSSAPRIRQARPDDVGLIFSLIVELATYERAADRVLGSEELLERALFGARPVAEAVIAEVDGEPAGFALFYPTFSTWQCVPGMWLEDLYVRESHRRGGVGGALMSHLAALALRRGHGRLEWSVLSWNDPAIDFYAKLGAEAVDDWQLRRLAGDSLQRAAARSSSDR